LITDEALRIVVTVKYVPDAAATDALPGFLVPDVLA